MPTTSGMGESVGTPRNVISGMSRLSDSNANGAKNGKGMCLSVIACGSQSIRPHTRSHTHAARRRRRRKHGEGGGRSDSHGAPAGTNMGMHNIWMSDFEFEGTLC